MFKLTEESIGIGENEVEFETGLSKNDIGDEGAVALAATLSSHTHKK